MADETTKTRTARTNRQFGYALTFRALIPVDRNDFKSQRVASEAIEKATETNDLSAILAMPGARIVPAGRNGGVMFGALPTPEEAAQEAEEPASESESEAEAEAETEATEETSAGRRGRRAA